MQGHGSCNQIIPKLGRYTALVPSGYKSHAILERGVSSSDNKLHGRPRVLLPTEGQKWGRRIQTRGWQFSLISDASHRPTEVTSHNSLRFLWMKTLLPADTSQKGCLSTLRGGNTKYSGPPYTYTVSSHGFSIYLSIIHWTAQLI